MKLKVFEAFAGYGSQAMALNRLRENYPQFDYEVVGISEIDKYALQAYQAVHGHCPNYGDISKIDWNTVPDFDLLTYSFPCTDISNAGQQKGLSKASGTRSSLLWECQRAIEIKRPKYLLMENVAALLSQKFLPDFKEWRNILGEYGYSSFTQILNATQFGVPQNRERVFMVSILGDCQYHFPAPFKLARRLKDVLEPVVDEKYYLSDKVISGFNAHLERMQERGNGFGWKPIEEPKAVSYTRDKDGIVTDRHLNDVYNTIHTGTGSGGNTDCYIAEPMCSVHPLSHAKEFNPETSIKTISPALRATDYKCPHCVYEPSVMQVGNLYPDTNNFKNRTMGRVYSADGLSPTINCCGGGDREPKILTPRRTEFGKQIRKQYEAHQVDMSRHDMTQLEPREDGVSNTLTSVQKDNLVAEPLLIPEATTKGYAEAYDGDSVNLALPNSKTRRGRVGHQQANTLDTSCNQGVVVNYRIRKLTPRECFRLMDVSESDIDKLLNAGLSNARLYKLAGNSIVCSVIYHVLRKMFIKKENESQQLTLF